MLTNRSALRSSTLILSSTLLVMAAEPLPFPTTLTDVVAGTNGGKANVSYGDVDGDGFTDLGIGGTIYWGSPNGWVGTSKIQPVTGSQLWIVPNVTGAGTDGKIRADLISVDQYSVGSLLRGTSSRTTFPGQTFPSPFLIKGRPAVGNFRSSALADIAWIDTSNYLQVATNNGGSFTSATPISVVDKNYAAVAAIDWTGTQSGNLDLLLISGNPSSTVQLFPYNNTTPSLTHSVGSAIYLPEITVGKIHSGTDQRQDAIVTGDNSSKAIFSSGSTTAIPNVSAFAGIFRGWIVPDVTGDGIDEVAFYGKDGQNTPSGGLLHGGASIDTAISSTVPSANRTIPDSEGPVFVIGYNSSDLFKSSFPLAVPYKTSGSTWERHLLFIDNSGYSTSSEMPILAPTLSGPLIAQVGTGAQTMVDPTVVVGFQTPGSITAIKVTVSGAVVGDAISNAVATTATSTDVLLNGDLVRVYSGNLTPTETKTLLTNLRFTGVAGGGQRSVTISVAGTAVSGDTATRATAYLSNTLNVSTFTANVAPVPALVFTNTRNASVGGTIIVEVSGGDGTYTVTVAGGTGFAGGSPAEATGANTKNVFITPTRAGAITVTVTDSTGLTGEFSFTAADLPTATEPAPAVLASVGEATVFGAICPGTFGGVNSLRAAFNTVDDRRTRGFSWNSEKQAYRELPAEPTGGLLPTDGVFLATRVALGLDFSGPAMPPGSTIVLRAGWNFVGLGPVQLTSGSVVRSHSLADDFTLTNLSGSTVPLSSITQAYQWTGTEYVTTATLQSGIGYWVNNVATPRGTILLTRKDSDVDGRVVQTRTESFAGNVGAPPALPNGDQQAQPENQGNCGSGSGIAVLLAGLMAFLKFGFRRK